MNRKLWGRWGAAQGCSYTLGKMLFDGSTLNVVKSSSSMGDSRFVQGRRLDARR